MPLAQKGLAHAALWRGFHSPSEALNLGIDPLLMAFARVAYLRSNDLRPNGLWSNDH